MFDLVRLSTLQEHPGSKREVVYFHCGTKDLPWWKHLDCVERLKWLIQIQFEFISNFRPVMLLFEFHFGGTQLIKMGSLSGGAKANDLIGHVVLHVLVALVVFFGLFVFVASTRLWHIN